MKKLSIRFIGYIGKDAVITQVNGKSVINFPVATTEKFNTKDGQEKEVTTWIDCSFWANKPKLVPYLKTGTQVSVEGRPSVRAYTTNAGVNGASLQCTVFDLLLLNGNNKIPSETTTEPVTHVPAPSEELELTDDLPF